MRPLLILLLLLVPAARTLASDGVVEINQASVEAAGGFPFTISAPGNYVLTSDLEVPGTASGIVLATSDVTIDLNGFAIRGSYSCTGGCPLGAGLGISLGPSIAFGRDSTVRNGRVSGFGAGCVRLNSNALVSDLMVADCGGDGIAVSSGSLVTRNRVLRTGQYGIRLIGTVHPPAFAHNTVGSAGQGGGSFAAVIGGTPSAGNSCDDGSCTRRGERRYYLTTTSFDGNEALGACDAGFHMASFFEIRVRFLGHTIRPLP